MHKLMAVDSIVLWAGADERHLSFSFVCLFLVGFVCCFVLPKQVVVGFLPLVTGRKL